MDVLSDEIIIHILTYLDPISILKVRQVSQRYHNLSYENSLWKTLCQKLEFKELFPTKNWEWLAKSQLDKPKNGSLGTDWHRSGLYSGDWYNSQPHGYGFHKSNDSIYGGEWLNGKKEGKGKKRYFHGDVLEGTFINDEPSKAVKHYHNGDIYDGEWHDSVRHGLGKYKWAIGDTYIGEWQTGNLHGTGIYHWVDGRQYNGNWENHNQNGKGIFEWSDNYKYEGDWIKGKRHGQGKIIDKEEIIYDGKFSGDLAIESKTLIKWDGFFNLSFVKQRELINQMRNHPTYSYRELLHLINID